ncbi:hypothetical protein [Sneathiella aquimaris]|uniref:hypothetical protein n=1 Tax=Sneathiella aquimaris TaxID=2599305 RepID=UPI00146ABFA7|nr:hypothetical protein [Sneathiella aquimaris]
MINGWVTSLHSASWIDTGPDTAARSKDFAFPAGQIESSTGALSQQADTLKSVVDVFLGKTRQAG